MPPRSHPEDDRCGARQPERFDPERASRLDDPARFEYLPPQEVLRLLAIPPKGRVLDFGTGTGTYAIELARLRPDAEVIALDEQPAMLARLQEKLAALPLPNLKPWLAGEQAGRLGPIDRVLALNVLHELGDEALMGLRRLLQPDGLALFIDWNAAADRPVGPPRDHVYAPLEARARLENLGFKAKSEHLFLYHYAFLAR